MQVLQQELTCLYQWSNAAGVIGTTPTVEVGDPGVYTLQVTDPSNGCTSNATIEITEDVMAPTIAVTNAELTCSVNTADLCYCCAYYLCCMEHHLAPGCS